MGSNPTGGAMSTSCATCGIKWVRNIGVGYSAIVQGPYRKNEYAMAFDFDFTTHKEKPVIKFWNDGEWEQMTFEQKRFWLPFVEDLTYEEAMPLHMAWAHDAKQNGEQLVVYYADGGCVCGGIDTPWIGTVRLGAFRGKFLDFIEPQYDDQTMGWMEIAQQWVADPKTKYTNPSRDWMKE